LSLFSTDYRTLHFKYIFRPAESQLIFENIATKLKKCDESVTKAARIPKTIRLPFNSGSPRAKYFQRRQNNPFTPQLFDVV
jgi:hypothetical protein